MPRPLFLTSLLLLTPLTAQAAPQWVSSGGVAAAYPAQEFLTGFAMAGSARAAKRQAAGDLAMKIVVRIEQTTMDVSAENAGATRYEMAMMTRASTDVRIANLAYLSHQEGEDFYALAFVRRSAAAAQKIADRDRSIALADTCVSQAAGLAENKHTAAALKKYMGCQTFVTLAVEADAVIRSIARSRGLNTKQATALAQVASTIDNSILTLSKGPASSVDDALETLALQLSMQGIGKKGATVVAPLTYGTTRFSSVFGRSVAADLSALLARTKLKKGQVSGPLSAVGTYSERGETVRISVTVRRVDSGAVVGTAKAEIKRAKVPASMPLRPLNFEQALVDSKLLAEGEMVSGGLRVEIWTTKGDRNLVFTEGEELKIYMRVNQPAWVRLFYLLANKAKVPLEQGYFIDASKVNRAVEYPDAFEVSPPFGVEQIFAVAHTERPKSVQTKSVKIGGESYDVVDDQTIVRHRGLKRKKKTSQISEARLTLTTTPR